MRTGLTSGLLIGLLAAGSVFSQETPHAQSATMSAPGKAATLQKVTASVVVSGIDESTRELTLRDSSGREFRVIGGPDVKNFDRIKLNDTVEIEFLRALSLALTQADATENISESYLEESAPAGMGSGSAIVQRLTAVAEVVAIDRAGKTITLQGPGGRIVELDVRNPDHFNVIRVGSRVRVEYTEAVALSVEPSASPHRQ